MKFLFMLLAVVFASNIGFSFEMPNKIKSFYQGDNQQANVKQFKNQIGSAIDKIVKQSQGKVALPALKNGLSNLNKLLEEYGDSAKLALPNEYKESYERLIKGMQKELALAEKMLDENKIEESKEAINNLKNNWKIMQDLLKEAV